jgi:ribosomal protein L10
MKRSRKESFIAEFEARLDQSPIFYITDFSGLPVKAMTRLRRELRAVGCRVHGGQEPPCAPGP